MSYYNMSIRSFARLRPDREPAALGLGSSSVVAETGTGPRRVRSEFPLDGVFGPGAGQEEVFQAVGLPLVMRFFEEHNCLLMAYGETGSGKTHSMLGSDKYADRGIILRSLETIFRAFSRPEVRRDFQLKFSFLEIYNEQVKDLLAPDAPKSKRKLETSIVPAETIEQATELYLRGCYLRKTECTGSNFFSSRSHCIFAIYLINSITSKTTSLFLVDLAGSEKIFKFETNPLIINESKNINLSLLNLEKVILALEEASRHGRAHIPFRNSTLTTFLRPCFEHESLISMLFTLNNSAQHISESLATLKFAMRCRNLKITTQQVEEPRSKDSTLLVKENEFLKKQIRVYKELYEEVLTKLNNKSTEDALFSKPVSTESAPSERSIRSSRSPILDRSTRPRRPEDTQDFDPRETSKKLQEISHRVQSLREAREIEHRIRSEEHNRSNESEPPARALAPVGSLPSPSVALKIPPGSHSLESDAQRYLPPSQPTLDQRGISDNNRVFSFRGKQVNEHSNPNFQVIQNTNSLKNYFLGTPLQPVEEESNSAVFSRVDPRSSAIESSPRKDLTDRTRAEPPEPPQAKPRNLQEFLNANNPQRAPFKDAKY